MKISPTLILALIIGTLGGCNSTPLSTDPYRPLSALVAADDAVVIDATTAVKTGILPAKDATSVANAESVIALGLPLAVQVAGQTGSPTALGAITLAVMNGQVAQLATDVAVLRSAVTGALAGVVKAAKVRAEVKK